MTYRTVFIELSFVCIFVLFLYRPKLGT